MFAGAWKSELGFGVSMTRVEMGRIWRRKSRMRWGVSMFGRSHEHRWEGQFDRQCPRRDADGKRAF